MPLRYFLLLTSATLLIAPPALADQDPVQTFVQSPSEANYSRHIEANPFPFDLQELKHNQVVAEPSPAPKTDHASLLGNPQQIQLSSTPLTTKPAESKSTQNPSFKAVFETSPLQPEVVISSTTNSQSNKDDLSICKKPGNFQEQPKADGLLVRDFKVFVLEGKDSREPVLQSEINDIIKDCKNRVLNLEQRTSLSDTITRRYLNEGYITSRAVLQKPEGNDKDGYILPIKIIEGSLEQIEVDFIDNEKIDIDRNGEKYYACKRIQAALGIPFTTLCDSLKPVPGNPLNTRKLENELRLLSLEPIFREINPVLRRGNGEGQSILKVEVKKAKPFNFNISFNNYSPPSIGAQRTELGVRFNNVLTAGDIFAASQSFDPFNFSVKRGLTSLSYQVPLSIRNNTLLLRLESRREKIVQEPFDQFDFQAKSELYEVIYRHPLIRSYSNEFALSVGFTYQNGQTFVFNDTPFPFGIGPDAEGVSRTSVIRFTQEYIHRGEYVTWAVRSQFNLGTSLFGATSNSDPIPDGKFFSWLGQAQRIQRLFDNLLIVQAEVQLSPNSLLPSQQFVIGGGQSLRGYRQNIRFGDNGLRFSTEYRLNLITRSRNNGTKEPILQIAPFFDAGLVWNRSDNPNKLPKQTFLAGVGTGLLWQTPLSGLTVRVDYAFPLVDLRDRGNNLQDNGLYFTINYQL